MRDHSAHRSAPQDDGRFFVAINVVWIIAQVMADLFVESFRMIRVLVVVYAAFYFADMVLDDIARGEITGQAAATSTWTGDAIR